MIIFSAILFVSAILTSCGPSESNIATKTFQSGYKNLFFKDDHTIEIYQSASGSYARGCAAVGKWSIEDGKVKIQITQSYCGTESYSELNGLFKLNGNCLEKGELSFCND